MILDLRIHWARAILTWHRFWYNWHIRRAAVNIARADIIDWRVSRAFGNLCILENER